MGTFAQIGIAMWKQGEQRGRAGVLRVPPALRDQWGRAQKENRYNDIFEVEAIGPLLILHNWGSDVADCLWLHFIDNAAALATLVRGSSSVMSGERIAGLTWSHVVGLRCLPWFDRVESSANPADGLSRGKLAGPWDLDRSIRLPRELLAEPALEPRVV